MEVKHASLKGRSDILHEKDLMEANGVGTRGSRFPAKVIARTHRNLHGTILARHTRTVEAAWLIGSQLARGQGNQKDLPPGEDRMHAAPGEHQKTS
jgi:hypothetical protein